MKFYVYIHTSPSKKRYVGVTSQHPETRWKKGWGYERQKHFFAAIQKYGWDNFIHQVFEVPSREAMFQNEKELIELFKTNDPRFGYNTSSGGEKTPAGWHLSKDSKQKMGDAHKKKVVDEYGIIYESRKECQKILQLCHVSFNKKIKTGELKYA